MTRKLSKHTESLLALLNDPAYFDGRLALMNAQATHGSVWHLRYTAMPGTHRDRIVRQDALVRAGEQPDWTREQRSVRCFVGRTDGTIYYAGGWNSPAKWGNEFATEFSGTEHVQYAEFTRDNGWGYKGNRAKWEERKAE